MISKNISEFMIAVHDPCEVSLIVKFLNNYEINTVFL